MRSQVTLEVILHEAGTSYAEWEMWREWPELDIQRPSEWISRGTTSTLESAIDHALNAWRDAQAGAEDPVPPQKARGQSKS